MLSATLLCLVIAILDGDTLTVRCGRSGPQQQVRIYAIDAPERYQPFGESARNSLVELCLNVQARIERLDLDRYERTLGTVQCRGQDVAAHQVRCGLAWVYVRYASRRTDLLALQGQAQAMRSGLWSDTHPVPPWEWRRR